MNRVRFRAVSCALAALVPATMLPAAAPAAPIAITGGTVHPVSSPEIAGGVVLVEDGVLRAVGPASEVVVPDDAVRIDATGRHVWPGLIDAHCYLGLLEIAYLRQGEDLNEHGTMNPNARAEVALDASSWHYETARAQGVLLANVAPRGDLVPGTSAAVALDGWTWEEMVRRAPVGLVIRWPRLRGASTEDREKHAQEVARLDEMIREARAYAEGANAQETPRDVDVRWESLRPVLSGDAPVWIAATRVGEMRAAMDWAQEHGLRMVLLDGDHRYSGDSAECAEELAARDIPVIVAPIRRPPVRWIPYDESYELAGRLHAAGVRVAFGTWSAMQSRRLHEQAGVAAAFGMPRGAAERAITLEPARVLGLDDRYGSLEPGKSATLILVDGDLLDVSAVVERIWIDGREISLESRQTRLRDRWSARPR